MNGWSSVHNALWFLTCVNTDIVLFFIIGLFMLAIVIYMFLPSYVQWLYSNYILTWCSVTYHCINKCMRFIATTQLDCCCNISINVFCYYKFGIKIYMPLLHDPWVTVSTCKFTKLSFNMWHNVIFMWQMSLYLSCIAICVHSIHFTSITYNCYKSLSSDQLVQTFSVTTATVVTTNNLLVHISTTKCLSECILEAHWNTCY